MNQLNIAIITFFISTPTFLLAQYDEMHQMGPLIVGINHNVKTPDFGGILDNIKSAIFGTPAPIVTKKQVITEEEMKTALKQYNIDAKNHNRFKNDIISMIKHKRKESEGDIQSHVPQYPYKTTYQNKIPKHHTLKKLYNIAKPIENQLTSYGRFSCPSPDGYFSVSGSCSSYYHCSHGVSRMVTCGPGLAWNPITMICDWRDKVYC